MSSAVSNGGTASRWSAAVPLENRDYQRRPGEAAARSAEHGKSWTERTATERYPEAQEHLRPGDDDLEHHAQARGSTTRILRWASPGTWYIDATFKRFHDCGTGRNHNPSFSNVASWLRNPRKNGPGSSSFAAE